MDEQPTNPQAGWGSANQPPQPTPQTQQPQQPQQFQRPDSPQAQPQPWQPQAAQPLQSVQLREPAQTDQLWQGQDTAARPSSVPQPWHLPQTPQSEATPPRSQQQSEQLFGPPWIAQQPTSPQQNYQPGQIPQTQQPQQVPQMQPPQQQPWQPQQSPPNASPQPPTWQPAGVAQLPSTPQKPQKPTKQLFSKRMIIVAVALVLLLMLAAAAMLLFAGGNSKSQYDKATSQISQSLATNGKVTDADLVLVDKTDLLLASANAMARQPVHHLISETIGVGALNGKMAGDHVEAVDATFDYRSKDLNLTSQNHYMSAPNVLDFNRCVDGVAYTYYDLQVRSDVRWERAETAGSDEGKDYCPLTGFAGVAIADGVNAGGLTTVQSNTFVQEVYRYASKGLLRISDAGLTERDGRQYIRLKAEIGWVQENIGGSRQSGMEYFMRAFKATGLNPQQHPYTTLNANSDKVRITTYIDPKTMLPAYAEYLTDIGIDSKTGNLRPATEENPYTLRRVQYGFGGGVVRGTVDTEPQAIKLSWPAEKR